MSTAPKSIKVMVLPADGSDHYYKSLETVQTDIPPIPPTPAYETEESAKLGHELLAATHRVYYYPYRAPQPNISLLPIPSKEEWNDDAWEKRAVSGTAGVLLHILFTCSKRGMAPNPHFGSAVWGDAFLLKLSDTEDEDGRKFYVDLKPEDWTEEELQWLVRAAACTPKV